MAQEPNPRAISRRQCLTWIGAGSVAALAACQPAPASPSAEPTAPAAGTTPTPAPAKAPAAPATTAPAKAPTAPATTAAATKPAAQPAAPFTLRIGGGPTGGPGLKWLQEVVFPAFKERYPNVTIDHSGMQLDQYRTALPLAIKSGQEDDVFMGPFWLPLYRPVKEGWFLEIGPLLGADFIKSMPKELFEEGRTVFHGKTYALPNVAFQPGGFLFYNKNLMRAAGLDPAKPPATWSELRQQAKAITEAGKGQSFGIIEGGKQLNRFMDDVGYLASKAGGHSAQPSFQRWNYQNGRNEYDSSAYIAATELLLGLRQDNSFMPGFMNMTGTDGVAHFTEQRAGFFIYGPWNIQEFLQNKEIDFDVAPLPHPDSGPKGKLQYPRQAVTVSFASARTKNPEVAVAYMKHRWGPEMMTSHVKYGLGSSAINYVNKPEYFPSPQSARCAQLVFSERNVPPEIIRRNPEASMVLEEYKEPSPDIQRVMQGIMSGQIGDYKAALADLAKKMNAELDRAIGVAKSNGAKVSREDWVFPNYSPLQDYNDELYKSLQ